jgi:hypothetical protein
MTAYSTNATPGMSALMTAFGSKSGLDMRSAGRPARSRGCKSLAMKE